MKTVVRLLSAGALLALLGITPTAAKPKAKPLLRHVVAIKFKSSAPVEQIHKVESAFRDLKNGIPQIVSFEAGLNNSPENRNKGFTHGFILTFKNEKDRDAYLQHPAHQHFVQLAMPVIEDVFVIDFFGK